jgi:hypothetical protein
VRTWLVPIGSCTALVIFLISSPAAAFEQQWHAGVDAGYASLFGDQSSAGYGGGGHLGYGLSDTFNALLEVDLSRHPSTKTSVWSSGLGVAYTLDVARAVPYAGLLAGGYKFVGDISTAAPGFQIALGLDYQIERHFAAGFQFRMHTIFAPEPMGTVAYATTFLRFEYLWGF